MQPTQSPSDHYRDAVRLLAAAESAGTDPAVQAVAALAAIGHCLLAAAPRRARRAQHEPSRRREGGSPRQRWINGSD
jgi:hypothetical protein